MLMRLRITVKEFTMPKDVLVVQELILLKLQRDQTVDCRSEE